MSSDAEPRDSTAAAATDVLSVDEVLESLSAIVIGVDAHGSINAWNSAAQRALGATREEVWGRSLLTLSLPLRDKDVLTRLLSAAHGDKPVRIDDVSYLRPDGAEGLLGLTASPLAQRLAGPRPLLVLGRDITEQRLRETRLSQSQKLDSIGQLAAGLAHEVNTPAQYVSHNLSFLRDAFLSLLPLLEELLLAPAAADSQTTSEQSRRLLAQDGAYLLQEIPRAIEQAMEGAGRVAVVVRAMREVSHPGSLAKLPANIHAAIESAITLAGSRLRDTAELRLELDPGLPLVSCQLGEISQVVLTLLLNASDAIASRVYVDAGAGRGLITVSTSRKGAGVVLRVSDTGVGIAESARGRIFELFYSTKPVGTGTGHGLSLARAIVVDNHRGSIEVDCLQTGVTTFTVWLPCGT